MKREALLDAAEAVLQEHGSQALTLSAVAEHAGVSKGGLLYHFPTKEALITALVKRVIDEFDELIAEHAAGASYTLGFVEATFAILAAPSGERTARRWAAITAAATTAEQRGPLTEAMRRWHRRDPAKEADPVTAAVVRLAAEGLWEVAAQDPGGYSAEEFTALRRRMLDLL